MSALLTKMLLYLLTGVAFPDGLPAAAGPAKRNCRQGTNRENTMQRRHFMKTTAIAALTSLALSGAAWAQNATLKIGFVGVTSGPAAAWGGLRPS